MKKALPYVVAVLIIMQFMMLSRIGSLQNELANTKNELINLSSLQSGHIVSLYHRIDKLLSSQDSILSRFDYVLGAVDPNELTVLVTFTISPKELTADTRAVLHVSGASTAMVRNGTVFTAAIPVDFFKQMDVTVALAEGNTEKIERLAITKNLSQEVLLSVFSTFEGNNHFMKKVDANSGTYQIAGKAIIETKPVPINSIQSASLVIDIDGRIVADRPLPANPSSPSLTENIDEKIEIAAGQKLTMSAKVTDQLGLSYTAIVDQFALDAQSNPVRSAEWRANEVTITDRNGKVRSLPSA